VTLPFDRVQGTLDMLILKTLLPGAQHGWAISRAIRESSGEAFQINQGALYPALHRLEDKGWVRARWGTTENNRRARFYQLTPAGRAQLAAETEGWLEYVRAVNLVMQLSSN
jgi:PadR family transcriptional regulator, regulatory protein PadR